MNGKERGFLFAFLTLILLLAIISSNYSINSIEEEMESKLSTIAAITVVNNKYNNVFTDIVSLNERGTATPIFERTLPFEYDLDSNSFTVIQRIPLDSETLMNFINTLNAYALFVSDTNYLHTFDGVNVEIQTLDYGWGGTDKKAEFVVLPECMNYSLTDLNEVNLEAGNCSPEFDLNSVQRFDVNIEVIDPTEDYNRVSCDLYGYAGCVTEPFNEGDERPFLEMHVIYDECDDCSFEGYPETISAHLTSLQDNNVTVWCQATGPENCDSNNSITLSFNQGLKIIHGGDKQIRAKVKTTFKEDIDSFQLVDYSINVSKEEFKVSKAR